MRSFNGVNQPQHEVDHSPPSRAEVKNEWRYTPIPAICLYAMDRDNFAFTFTNIFSPTRHGCGKGKMALNIINKIL
jgi:hypothetical protein